MAEQTLGDLLRRLRKAKGWRLEDVVTQIREMGWLTSTSTLSRFETGSRSPSAEQLRELLYVYGADDATRALCTKLPRAVPPYTKAEKGRTRKGTIPEPRTGRVYVSADEETS